MSGSWLVHVRWTRWDKWRRSDTADQHLFRCRRLLLGRAVIAELEQIRCPPGTRPLTADRADLFGCNLPGRKTHYFRDVHRAIWWADRCLPPLEKDVAAVSQEAQTLRQQKRRRR